MENGKRVLEFIAVQRADSNQWAIPGVRKLLYTIYCSHSPTKLREGNVLSRVCLSVCPQKGDWCRCMGPWP